MLFWKHCMIKHNQKVCASASVAAWWCCSSATAGEKRGMKRSSIAAPSSSSVPGAAHKRVRRSLSLDTAAAAAAAAASPPSPKGSLRRAVSSIAASPATRSLRDMFEQQQQRQSVHIEVDACLFFVCLFTLMCSFRFVYFCSLFVVVCCSSLFVLRCCSLLFVLLFFFVRVSTWSSW